MPHQCVRCGTFYEDGSFELLKGCGCGGKFFFYVKNKPIEEDEAIIKLSNQERKQIEQDVMDILGEEVEHKPVILDLESIRIKQPGKYELDLVELFKGKPLVFKMADGKYLIDLAGSFEKGRDE